MNLKHWQTSLYDPVWFLLIYVTGNSLKMPYLFLDSSILVRSNLKSQCLKGSQMNCLHLFLTKWLKCHEYIKKNTYFLLEGFFTLGIYYRIMFYLTMFHQALNCVWTNETTTFSWNLALNVDDMWVFILFTVIEKSQNIIRILVSLLNAISLFLLCI